MAGFLGKTVAKTKDTMKKQQEEKVVSIKPPVVPDIEVEDEILLVNWRLIHPDPNQPRKERDENEFLKVLNSIKETGTNRQPVEIRKHPTINGEFMLIVGEGRWTACKHWDLKVRAILKTEFDEDQDSPDREFKKMFVMLSENEGRNDLPLVRAAEAFAKLVALNTEGLSVTAIGEKLGYNRSKTSRYMKIASASDDIKQLSIDGISNNVNLFSSLIELQNLTDQESFSGYLQEVRDKKLFERNISAAVRKLKKKANDPVEDQNTSEVNASLDKTEANSEIEQASRSNNEVESVGSSNTAHTNTLSSRTKTTEVESSSNTDSVSEDCPIVDSFEVVDGCIFLYRKGSDTPVVKIQNVDKSQLLLALDEI